MTPPYDYARCMTNGCPLPCRRKEPGHPTYQTMQFFPGGDDCRGLIPIERYRPPLTMTWDDGPVVEAGT
jgi:hypothetical protein